MARHLEAMGCDPVTGVWRQRRAISLGNIPPGQMYRRRCSSYAGRPPVRRHVQTGHGAAQRGEAPGRFAMDKGPEAPVDQLGLLTNAGDPRRLGQEGIIDIRRRSHTYECVCCVCICQGRKADSDPFTVVGVRTGKPHRSRAFASLSSTRPVDDLVSPGVLLPPVDWRIIILGERSCLLRL